MFIKYYHRFVPQQLNKAVNCHVFTAPLNFKSFKKLIDYSKVPKIDENDLQIQYVRGSGPGGQATNKTSNKVVMKHVPTNIVVMCHETRSQTKNREIALEWLINKLDLHFNGEDAVENQTKRLMKKESEEKARRRDKRAQLKAAFKEREGLD